LVPGQDAPVVIPLGNVGKVVGAGSTKSGFGYLTGEKPVGKDLEVVSEYCYLTSAAASGPGKRYIEV
jgi:hypothetical protein